MPGRSSLPVFAVLAAVVLWGASYSAMKSVVAVLGPQGVMWSRMIVALAVLAPFAPRLGLRFARRDWKALALMCLLMPCAYFFFESSALLYTSSMQAGIVSATVPLLVALGAWLFLKERITPRLALGLTLSLAGVALMSLLGSPSEAAKAPLLGNALEVCAMVCAAGSMVTLKRLSSRYGPWALTALQTAAGALFFLPGAPDVVRQWPTLTVGGTLPLLLFLGAGVTLGAFGLYNWGMSRMEASRTSAFINLVPVLAVLFGWLFLGERLNPSQVPAALLVLGGVGLSQFGASPASDPESPLETG